MLTVQADNISASAWQDRKVFTVIYSGFDPKEETTVQQQQKDGNRITVTCPVAIYNRHMGGVKHCDQLRGYNAYKIKSSKYIYNFLLGVTFINSFVLHRMKNPSVKIPLKKFQELLAKELIGDYCSRRRAGRISAPVQTLSLFHFPSKIVSGTAQRNMGRYSLCRERNICGDTQWHCNRCDVWLCHQITAEDCFPLWHQRRNNA